eukprot:186674_1
MTMASTCVSYIFYILLVINVSLLAASSDSEYKLPTTIQPILYTITLSPNFSTFTFNGHEEILVNISQHHFAAMDTNSTDSFQIQLHVGPQMVVTNLFLSVDLIDGSHHLNANQSYNNDTQIMSFVFATASTAIRNTISASGETYIMATIHVTFNGILRKDMKGFYISQYTFENTTIYNAVTQFESTDARRAFPCFDEPSFKAQFNITMITPAICTVLSNMNVLSQTLLMDNTECAYTAPASMGGVDTACKMVQFETSPAMSTYLVAFVVGLYKNVTNHTVNGLKTSVYFPMDSDTNHAQYALDAAVKILPFYEQLFGVPFPLPKMDCIALSDFSAGAMENWGLVTYRRTALLVDPVTSSESALRRVVVVIAHEFAHQWFGDIVTMTWWDDLWLNEGFASFVEHIGTNYSSPAFDIWNFFLINMDNVLSIDASYYTHPIQLTVNDPNEIDTLFDSVTYDKGMSVIRMLYTFMGSESFMNGIQSYLKSHVYGSAKTQQLWEALGGETIINMMNTWVLQPGFPVLNVSIKDMTDDHVIFNVQQQRMNKYGPTFNVDNDEYALPYDTQLVAQYNEQLWIIPLQIKMMGASVDAQVMSTRDQDITLPRRKSDDGSELYLFNQEMSGFYRVLYDQDSFLYVMDAWSNGGSLSEFDKFSLVSDLYAFAISNYIAATDYFAFLRQISLKEAQSPSFVIWNSIISSLIEMDSILCETHSYDIHNILSQFRSYALDIVSSVWSAIDQWNVTPNDSENTINLRSTLIYALVRFEDEDTIEFGYNMWHDAMVNDQIAVNDRGEMDGLDTNILRPVIECALTYDAKHDGIENILGSLLSIYGDLNSEYQGYVLRAVGAVYLNTNLSAQALEFVLASGSVRDQDKLRALYSLRRCYGRNQLWQYLTQNGYWESLFSVFGSGFSAQDLTEIANTFASLQYYRSVYDFYYAQNGHKTSSNARSVNETLENIQIKTEWIANNYDKVREFLSTYVPVTPTQKPSDDEWNQYSMMRYIWIGLMVVFVLLCCVCGFRWIWNKQYTNLRLFAYQRQSARDHHESDVAMIQDQSLADDQFDRDDNQL